MHLVIRSMGNANVIKAFRGNFAQMLAKLDSMAKIVLNNVDAKMVERVITSPASVSACPVGRGHCKKHY
jgi:hypothetical protein